MRLADWEKSTTEKVRGAGGAPDVWGELGELGLVSLEKGRLGRWGTSLQFLAIGWWVAEKTESNSLQSCILKGREPAATVRGILSGCKKKFLTVRVGLEQCWRDGTVSSLGDLKQNPNPTM